MINWQEIYNKFLQERKTSKLEEVTHRHHIVPRYEQGSNRENNLVRLSVKDHATAHWLRYKWLGKLQDKVAWLMLSGKTVEGERRDLTRPRCRARRLSRERRERRHHRTPDQRAMGSVGQARRTSRRAGEVRHLLPAPHRSGRPGKEVE